MEFGENRELEFLVMGVFDTSGEYFVGDTQTCDVVYFIIVHEEAKHI